MGLEQTNARLAQKHLLSAAQGLAPTATLCIKDVDLSKTPSLPPDHREHHRREEYRIRTQTQNEENAERRWLLTMQAWTEVYTLLKTSTECTAAHAQNRPQRYI